MNIAVFCSGNGSNFQAIVDACRKGLFKAKIALMVCDNPAAYAVKRAEKEKIKTLIIERANFSSKQEFEARIIQELEKEKIELICLAGYMRILSPGFVKKYSNRILNIHPAILPSFKGTHGIRDALDYGVKVTGVTVHFVNEDMDAGPIILQEAVKIKPDDTEESLAERIHSVEHRLYPEAIRLFTKERLKTAGRGVKILTAAAIFLSVFGSDPKAMFGREALSLLPPAQEMTFYRETPPAVLPKEKIPLPVTEDSLSINKTIKPNLTDPSGNFPGYSSPRGHPFALLRAGSEARRAEGSHEILRRFAPQDEGSKNAKSSPTPHLTDYNKLGLTTPALYDIANYTDSYHTELLNPNLDIERPLTREEIEKMRIESSLKVARAFAEAMDSINATFAYNGVNSLIDTATKVIKFRNHIRDDHHLYFRVDRDQALLRYKRRF